MAALGHLQTFRGKGLHVRFTLEGDIRVYEYTPLDPMIRLAASRTVLLIICR